MSLVGRSGNPGTRISRQAKFGLPTSPDLRAKVLPTYRKAGKKVAQASFPFWSGITWEPKNPCVAPHEAAATASFAMTRVGRSGRPISRRLLLSPVLRRLLGAAMREVLQHEGPAVCETGFGKQLGGGVFEFRVNGDPQPIIDQERKRKGKEPMPRSRRRRPASGSAPALLVASPEISQRARRGLSARSQLGEPERPESTSTVVSRLGARRSGTAMQRGASKCGRREPVLNGCIY